MTPEMWGSVAVVGAAFVTAVVGPWAAARRTARDNKRTRDEIAHRVGTPNGKGNLVEMAEALLAGQATQDLRLARNEEQMNKTLTRLGRIERARRDDMTEVCERLDKLEGSTS